MKLDPSALRLYLCTDRVLLGKKTLVEAVEAAISGGVTIVQLREKNVSAKEFFFIAKELLCVTRLHKIPLIINDRLDIALAAGADGVHLGQDDVPPAVARIIAGKDFIIGVSAHNAEEAVKAEKEGADYIGSGAVFQTGTKADAGVIGPLGLAAVVNAVKIPVIGIGGINALNIVEVKKTGAAGAAVISAVLSKADIKGAAAELRRILDS